jgi:hypothetical protein
VRGLPEGDADVGLGDQVVDLVGVDLVEQAVDTQGVSHIPLHEPIALGPFEVPHAGIVGDGDPPADADDLILLGQEQLGEEAAVLTRCPEHDGLAFATHALASSRSLRLVTSRRAAA